MKTDIKFTGNYRSYSYRGRINRGRKGQYQGTQNRQDIQPRKCRSCQSTEHLIRYCPVRFCQACGKRGHDQYSNTCSNFQSRLYEPDSTDNVGTEETVTLQIRLGDKSVNAILDSGAGCSIIDIGSLEEIGSENKVSPCNGRFVNASGILMDIAGVVKLPVQLKGMKPVVHEFKVLNTKTYSNIIIGRDFMRLFGSVEFDFDRNRVHLGRT